MDVGHAKRVSWLRVRDLKQINQIPEDKVYDIFSGDYKRKLDIRFYNCACYPKRRGRAKLQLYYSRVYQWMYEEYVLSSRG